MCFKKNERQFFEDLSMNDFSAFQQQLLHLHRRHHHPETNFISTVSTWKRGNVQYHKHILGDNDFHAKLLDKSIRVRAQFCACEI
jgi:hypothetical protein